MADELRLAIARQICAMDFIGDCVTDADVAGGTHRPCAETTCDAYRIAGDVIRTILRAMETPSEAMLTAGVQNNPTEWNEDTRDGDSGFPAEVANDVWRAMLWEFAREHGVEMEGSDGN